MTTHVLIIGATSDIAQSVAREYANEGAKLTLTVRGSANAQSLVSDLEVRSGHKVGLLALDVMDHAQRTDVHSHIDTLPDVVILCVGYLGDQSLAQADDAQAQQILEANFSGPVSVLDPLVNQMEARGSGHIVVVTSVAGDRGRASNYFYGAAKAGLQCYASGIRNRLHAKGINVLDVRPGFVDTKMTRDLALPPLLTAHPDQVARAIVNGIKKRKDIVYVKPIWSLIMRIIRALPEALFKRTQL